MSLRLTLATTAHNRLQHEFPSHHVALSGIESLSDLLLQGGGILNAVALLAFLVLRCLGLLDLDTMTLLPAASFAGAALLSLGVALACLRELRNS